MHVDFLVWDNHFVVQVPSRAATELCDDGVAVAEEVDVEVDVGTWLDGLSEYDELHWGEVDGYLPLLKYIAAVHEEAILLQPQIQGPPSTRSQ